MTNDQQVKPDANTQLTNVGERLRAMRQAANQRQIALREEQRRKAKEALRQAAARPQYFG